MANPKMCNILETPVKRTKICMKSNYEIIRTAYRGYFYVRFFEFSLGSFCALYKFPMLSSSKGYCCHSFHSISTKL